MPVAIDDETKSVKTQPESVENNFALTRQERHLGSYELIKAAMKLKALLEEGMVRNPHSQESQRVIAYLRRDTIPKCKPCSDVFHGWGPPPPPASLLVSYEERSRSHGRPMEIEIHTRVPMCTTCAWLHNDYVDGPSSESPDFVHSRITNYWRIGIDVTEEN